MQSPNDILLSRPRIVALLLLGVLAAGCQSAGRGPGTGSFASVTIQNRSLAEIAEATEAVFREDGFAGGRVGLDQFRFQKGGTRANQLAYGGILYPDGTILYRVEVTARELDPKRVLLECQVFRVRTNGDPFFDDSTTLRPIRSGPYQLLLNKVKRRLK